MNHSLTPKEIEVLRLLASGLVNKQIANIISRAEGTIRNHGTNIRAKLRAANTTHAVAIALRKGIID